MRTGAGPIAAGKRRIGRGFVASEAVLRNAVADHFKLLRGFLRRAREGFHVQLEESHESFEAARRIHESQDTLTTVRLFLLTDGVVKSAAIDQEQLRGSKCDMCCGIWKN